jgi:hypothetical protein
MAAMSDRRWRTREGGQLLVMRTRTRDRFDAQNNGSFNFEEAFA